MARYLVKVIGLGAQAIGRALVKTVRQEIESFHEAARLRQALNNSKNTNTAADEKNGMTLTEAKLILNIKDLGDQNKIDTNYQHLFEANKKPSGGSFYLQSKVYRAKERIDQELAKLHETIPGGIGTQVEGQLQAKKPGLESQRD